MRFDTGATGLAIGIAEIQTTRTIAATFAMIDVLFALRAVLTFHINTVAADPALDVRKQAWQITQLVAALRDASLLIAHTALAATVARNAQAAAGRRQPNPTVAQALHGLILWDLFGDLVAVLAVVFDG